MTKTNTNSNSKRPAPEVYVYTCDYTGETRVALRFRDPTSQTGWRYVADFPASRS